MLTTAALVLGLLPSLAVAQLLTTDAKCLPGFEWVRRFYHTYGLIKIFLQMFSSINQSPCDVAAELAGVCVGGRTYSPICRCLVLFNPILQNSICCPYLLVMCILVPAYSTRTAADVAPFITRC